ncbi:MAG: CvpA family protein [Gammaproteobacteria bacterium]|nr:CvpA family protein [Gammaproteobacteria bacterium]
MSVVDIAIVVIVLVSVVIGVWRGFIRETLSLLSWILAFWVAFGYAAAASAWFVGYVESPVLRTVTAFTALFLGTLLLASIVSFLLYKLFAATGITATDRTLGAAFGLLRGVAVVALLLALASATGAPSQPWWRQSVLVPRLQPVVALLLELFPKDVAQRLEKS